MKIKQLDHLVLTVKDIQSSIKFYTEVLGMQLVEYENNRKALKFNQQKINLHQVGKEFQPHAETPTTGSADLCFIIETPVDKALHHLQKNGIHIETGPVKRTGANTSLLSIYIRDPDHNLIELSNTL